MQATEGLSPRAYNSPVMYKGAHDLLPDESPRTQYAFPQQGDPCPHCGAKTGFIWRPAFFRCWCGTVLYGEVLPVMPLTPDMLIPEQVSGSLVNAVCDRCGKHFVKKAKNTSPYCQRCRSNIQSTEWREKNPERYRTTQRKHQKLTKEKQARKRELAKEFF